MTTRAHPGRYHLYALACAAYIVCPYHIYLGLFVPVHDRRTVFAIVGLLMGCMIHRICLDRGGARSLVGLCDSRLLNGIALLAAIASVGLESLDFLAFPFIGAHGSSLIDLAFRGSLSHAYGLETCAVLVGAAVSMFLFLCAHDRPDALESGPAMFRRGFPLSGARLLAAAPMLLALAGFASRSIWPLFISPYHMDASPLMVMGTGCLALLISAGLIYGCLIIERGALCALQDRMADRYYRCYGFIYTLVICLCLGQLTCMVLARYAYDPQLSVLASVCLGCLMALFVAKGGRLGGSAHPQGDAGAAGVEGLEDILHEHFGLSPREASFASSSLQGKGFSEISVAYDVRPGTVRSTFHRIYHKLDVRGEGGLHDLLMEDAKVAALVAGALPGETCAVFAGEPAPDAGATPIAHMMDSAATVLFLFVLMSLLLPLASPSGLWGIGQIPLVGIAIALMMIGLGGIARMALEGLDIRAHITPLFKGFPVVRGIAMVASGVAVLFASAFCLSYIGDGILVSLLGGYGDIAVALSYGVVVLWAFAWARRRFSQWDRLAIPHALCAMFLWVLVAQVGGKAIVILAAVLSVCLQLRLGLPARPSPPTSAARSGGFSDTLVLYGSMLSIPLAICYEEQWRSMGQESFAGASVVLFLSMSIAYFVAGWRWLKASHAPFEGVLICAAFVAATALTKEMAVFSVLCTLLVSISFLRGSGFAPALYPMCAMMGGAIMGSTIVFNKIQDLAVYPPPLVSALFGPGDNITVAIATVLVIAYLVAGTLLWRMAKTVWDECEVRFHDDAFGHDEALARRQKALLISHGLSDLQSDIMLLTASGLPARGIADRLCYAPATVKALRVASYRQLSIHDRSQLIALLSQVESV